MGLRLAIIDDDDTELWSVTETEIRETLDGFGASGLGSWVADELKQANNFGY